MSALPIGIDIGSTRVRVAFSERHRNGSIVVRGVAARERDPVAEGERDDATVLALEDVMRELGVKRRQCVSALGVPRATLRGVRFPRMSWLERRTAAKFEGAHEAWAGRRAITRVHAVGGTPQLFAVGRVDEAALRHHVATLRAARLQIVAIDYDACAYQRALEGLDAVVDIGYETLRLHALRGPVPITWLAGVGGRAVTEGIARELAIDVASAERRKRILGTAGAGEYARESCVDAVCALVEAAHNDGLHLERVGLLGNAARLPGLGEAVAERAGASVSMCVSPLLRTARMSEEAICAGSPDWTLAIALTTWRAA